MRGLNHCTFIGNLGKDPEGRYTQGGLAISTFSIAVNYSKKVDDEWREATEWVNVSALGKVAENVNEYLSKGSKVFVAGKYKTDSWTDSTSGDKKYKTYIQADEVMFLDSKPKAEDSEVPF
jgi:single-strand DNA-binding protein